jgi:hypothetical protein
VPERVWNEYLQCAIYIYPSESTAKHGEKTGGSGFLLGYPLDPPNITNIRSYPGHKRFYIRVCYQYYYSKFCE